MAKPEEPIVIKKYANRRLYNTGTSTYVTLEDLAAMVKKGEEFVVVDAKSSDDITRFVLTQIIFEQESKAGQNLLPATFLRQLIRFYGDSMQMLVPRYLEVSIDSLIREQEKFRHQMSQAFGGGPFAPLEEQVRRNMEMFERAFSMFAPFPRRDAPAGETPKASEPGAPAAGPQKPPAEPGDEIDDLKRQLEDVQKRLNKLSEGKG
jgi:polyhydroxyalkanoate synthesis repressor PhaR